MRAAVRTRFRWRSGLSLLAVGVFGSPGAACTPTGDLAPIEPTLDELDPIVVCDDVTFGELKYSDGLSDECRETIEHLLPEPSTTFTRLFTLGARHTEDGALEFHVHGARADGTALTPDDLSELQVEGGTVDGETYPIGEGVQIEPFAGSASVAFVTDHSRTVRAADLEAIATSEAELFAALPPGSSAGLWRFSREVEAALPFTTDADELTAALLPGETPARETTALYDALGAAVEALLERDDAIRLLVLATDGLDNASREYRRAEVAAGLQENGISGVVLSSLFAEAAALRSLFAQRAPSFEAPAMTDVPTLLGPYITSLASIMTVRISAEHAGYAQYRAVLAGRSVALR